MVLKINEFGVYERKLLLLNLEEAFIL